MAEDKKRVRNKQISFRISESEYEEEWVVNIIDNINRLVNIISLQN